MRDLQCYAKHGVACSDTKGWGRPRSAGQAATCTVSEVPSCLGMMSVQIWKQPAFSSSTPARMPQLSTPRRVLLAAYLLPDSSPAAQRLYAPMHCSGLSAPSHAAHTVMRGMV